MTYRVQASEWRRMMSTCDVEYMCVVEKLKPERTYFFVPGACSTSQRYLADNQRVSAHRNITAPTCITQS